MLPLERRAAFRAAVTLHRMTVAAAADSFGVSYNHLALVLKGQRQGSARLEEAIANFLGRPRKVVFSNREKSIG
jgi:transcriptional regulator with XRE-family HTH domain